MEFTRQLILKKCAIPSIRSPAKALIKQERLDRSPDAACPMIPPCFLSKQPTPAGQYTHPVHKLAASRASAWTRTNCLRDSTGFMHRAKGMIKIIYTIKIFIQFILF